MSSSTVPSPNTKLPAIVVNGPTGQGYMTQETSPTVIKQAHDAARSKVKERNRKQKVFELEIPLNLAFEEGTVWNLKGFTPDADQFKWLVYQVEHRISAKRGSTTRVTFHRCITEY